MKRIFIFLKKSWREIVIVFMFIYLSAVTNEANQYAQYAYDSASDAASYARSASSDAEDASSYASEAVDAAREAADYASMCAY